jgi:arylsulfatase
LTDKPNIVLIYPDQHRGDSMGCVGHPSIRTPNLDRLAAQGVTFGRCYTQSPLCMPARASLVTGRYVHEHGTWSNFSFPDRFGPSHIRNIHDAGYHTAVVGKTHMWVHGRGHTNEHVNEMRDWGFDDVHELTGPLASATVSSPYTDYLEEKGLLDGFREYLLRYIKNTFAMRDEASGGEREAAWELPPPPLSAEDHLDSYTGRKAVEWIENYRGKQPFYLQVLFPGPHDPFDSPREYRDRYPPRGNPVGILDAPQEPLPAYVRMLLRISNLNDMGPVEMQKLRSLYYGKVTLIDEAIGAVVDALERRGLLTNTWIIYTSDHGEMLGDHRLLHKIAFYDGAIQVPLIVRPPGGRTPRQSNATVAQLDVTASLIDIAGAKQLAGCGGHSLVPAVSKDLDSAVDREVIFSEVEGYVMAMTEKYKIVVDAEDFRPVEMYDRVEDTRELHNLASSPAHKVAQDEMLETHVRPFLSEWDISQVEPSQFRRLIRVLG